MLSLAARLTVQNLVDIAFYRLKLPETLTLRPVVVVPGVLLCGKPLDFLLQFLPLRQLGDSMLFEIAGCGFGYDKITFVLLPISDFCAFRPSRAGFVPI